MAFKFEKLEIWHLALDYVDVVYERSAGFPAEERFNLKAQIRRAATSVALNIAEGSTGQTNAEQARFLGMALRSLVETVACLHIAQRRGYLDVQPMRHVSQAGEKLARKIQAMRTAIAPGKPWVREEGALYVGRTMDDRRLTAGEERLVLDVGETTTGEGQSIPGGGADTTEEEPSAFDIGAATTGDRARTKEPDE